MSLTGADPGFPIGGAPTFHKGAPTYDFAKFSKKLDEIEKILGRRRGRPPLDPPLFKHEPTSEHFHAFVFLPLRFTIESVYFFQNKILQLFHHQNIILRSCVQVTKFARKVVSSPRGEQS